MMPLCPADLEESHTLLHMTRVARAGCSEHCFFSKEGATGAGQSCERVSSMKSSTSFQVVPVLLQASYAAGVLHASQSSPRRMTLLQIDTCKRHPVCVLHDASNDRRLICSGDQHAARLKHGRSVSTAPP